MNTRRGSRKPVEAVGFDEGSAIPTEPLTRWADLIWEYGLYSLFFILPLFFVRDLMVDPFVLPKVTLLRYVTVVVIVALIVRSLTLPRVVIRPTYLIWPLAAWLLINVGSAVQGISLTRSFFGEYERHDGLLTQTNYLVLFLLMANLVDSVARLRRVMATAAAGGALAALIGLMQFAGVPMVDVNELAEFNGRIFGTVGNPGFFGTYMVLTIPLLAAIALVADRDQRLWWIIGLLLSLAGLALSVTIGAWIALAASVPVFLYAVLGASSNRLLPAWALGVTVLAVLVIGSWALFGLPGMGGQPTDTVGNKTTAPAIVTKEATGRVRLLLWQASIEMIADHPWLGTGPNTFQAAVGRYITPEFAANVPAGEDPDRAHNAYLQAGVSTGIIGLLSYLVVLGVFGYRLLRATVRAIGPNRILLAGLSAAWVGYSVQDFFLFGVVPTAGVSWLLMGAAAGYVDSVLDGKRWSIELSRLGRLQPVVVAAAVLAGVWLCWTFTLPFVADARAKEGADATAFGDVSRSLVAYKQAVQLAPEQQRYREVYSATLLQAASRTFNQQRRQSHLSEALAQIDEAIARDPQYATLYFERAGVFEAIGSTADDRAYQDYLKARELRQYDYELLVTGADFMVQISRHDEALEMLTLAREIRPNDVNVAGLVVQSLVATSREQEAVAAMRPVVAANPRSAAARYWMGRALETSGETVAARDEYRRALEIDPRYLEAGRALDRVGKVE